MRVYQFRHLGRQARKLGGRIGQVNGKRRHPRSPVGMGRATGYFCRTVKRLTILIAFAGLGLSGCPGCFNPPVVDAGPDGTPCERSSDCADNEYCADEGFCVEGLPPGTCESDADCDGEEICVFPPQLEGQGICVNPHDCTVDEDCDEGQVCEDANGDGYRDCVYPGCDSDDECEVELGDSCELNTRPKCVARACVCQDYCGADCGEERRCCAPGGENAMCIDEPGPCANEQCDPGFAGVASSFGAWTASLCDYADAQCSCEELPPLPVGALGAPHVLVVDDQDNAYAVAYNATYGDVVVAPAVSGTLEGWVFADGVPPVSDEAPIVAGPSGPRGGVEAPGDDVGSELDAAFGPDGTLHIVARDATSLVLKHIYGPPAGPFTARVLDDDGDGGLSPQVAFDSDGAMIVTHVVRRDNTNWGALRLLALADPVGAVDADYELDAFPLSGLDCEAGCADGEVCPAVADGLTAQCVPAGMDCQGCGLNDVCTTSGCQGAADPAPKKQGRAIDGADLVVSGTGLVLFGHDPRAGTLMAYRRSTGDVVAGTANFVTHTVWEETDQVVGDNPVGYRDPTRYGVVSAHDDARELWLREYSVAFSSELDAVLIDDGERRTAGNAVANHPVNLPAVKRMSNGDTVLAWQDGLWGDVHARVRNSAGELGPIQILAGTKAAGAYAGHSGFAINVEEVAGQPLITAQHVWLGADPAEQTVEVLPGLMSCPTDDDLEPNDDVAGAVSLSAPAAARGMVCGGNEDWYEVYIGPGCTFMAELLFNDEDGDLEFRLLDSDGTTALDSGQSSNDNEFLEFETSSPGNRYLRVWGYQDQENAYTVRTECL